MQHSPGLLLGLRTRSSTATRSAAWLGLPRRETYRDVEVGYETRLAQSLERLRRPVLVERLLALVPEVKVSAFGTRAGEDTLFVDVEQILRLGRDARPVPAIV